MLSANSICRLATPGRTAKGVKCEELLLWTISDNVRPPSPVLFTTTKPGLPPTSFNAGRYYPLFFLSFLMHGGHDMPGVTSWCVIEEMWLKARFICFCPYHSPFGYIPSYLLYRHILEKETTGSKTTSNNITYSPVIGWLREFQCMRCNGWFWCGNITADCC